MIAALSALRLINRDTMRASAGDSAHRDDLTVSEQMALRFVDDLVRNRRILEIGVGVGQSVRALRQLSRDYVGIDSLPEMIGQCRKHFPFVRFDHADARSMPQYHDGSFDVVLFARNGLCMVNHADRLSILREVRRVLSPNGVFVFSTYNQASAEHDSRFTPPDFAATPNSAAPAPYKISIENQRRQLESTGFNGLARAFDLTGTDVEESTTDESVTFVARPKKVTMDYATLLA
jgi:SAM-dependent methyltransferase